MSELKTQKLNVLTLPLTGIQLIEASAGTGKTWTLAALYVRLILGHGWSGPGLMPPQILVMTFTEAATAELRDRIRERLAQAAQFFRGQPHLADDFLQDLQANLGTDLNVQHDERFWPLYSSYAAPKTTAIQSHRRPPHQIQQDSIG